MYIIIYESANAQITEVIQPSNGNRNQLCQRVTTRLTFSDKINAACIT